MTKMVNIRIKLRKSLTFLTLVILNDLIFIFYYLNIKFKSKNIFYLLENSLNFCIYNFMGKVIP